MASRNKRLRSGTVRNPGPNRGRVRNAKRLEVDGIKFKSLLEAFCYSKLKESGLKFEYEQHKYVLMEGFYYPEESFEDNGKTGFNDKQAYKVRDITYTPDFTDPQGRWVIECKGYANERFPMKWKMFKELLLRNGNPPKLYVPRNQNQVLKTIELIQAIKAST